MKTLRESVQWVLFAVALCGGVRLVSPRELVQWALWARALGGGK